MTALVNSVCVSPVATSILQEGTRRREAYFADLATHAPKSAFVAAVAFYAEA